MADKFADEIIDVTHQLLHSIAAGDWDAYAKLCDPDITAFEPEARGQLVAGLDFHKFYFNLERSNSPRNITLCSPKVWHLGANAAAICYVRLIQGLGADGAPHTVSFEETRIWHKKDGAWKHVHFHRSIGE
jgi:calcium/calmodulin-dependent protein kinase (CaM kinase) II